MKLTSELWAQMRSGLYWGNKRLKHQEEFAFRSDVEAALSTLPDAPALKVTLEEAREIVRVYHALDIPQPDMWDGDMQCAINTVLARRPRPQAQEPQSMPAIEHVHKWVNGHCYNENCSALQPTVEQEADGDAALIEKMYQVYWAATDSTKGLIAALAVARAHFSAHPPEGWHSTEQVKTATEQAARVCHHLGLGFGEMWDQIRARLTPPQKPVERVATRFLGDRWEITLDGGWWASVNAEEKALVVAAGLRASLDAGKEIRGE
jgi:hypothetical protein